MEESGQLHVTSALLRVTNPYIHWNESWTVPIVDAQALEEAFLTLWGIEYQFPRRPASQHSNLDNKIPSQYYSQKEKQFYSVQLKKVKGRIETRGCFIFLMKSVLLYRMLRDAGRNKRPEMAGEELFSPSSFLPTTVPPQPIFLHGRGQNSGAGRGFPP